MSNSNAASTYWQSVEQAATSTDELKSARAQELLRLRQLADGYRQQWFPKLPELTIDAIPMSGWASAKVDPVGGWGQGLSIKTKATRIDPFRWDSAADENPTLAKPAKDKSLIFGRPLLLNRFGEQLRRFEAELIVLQQLLRAEQHRIVEAGDFGHASARSDLKSWNGAGEWFADKANALWLEWCADRDYPFVPVRHGRVGYEMEHHCIAAFEDNPADQDLTHFRPSCNHWPMVCLSHSRDPLPTGESPAELIPVWDRWKEEQMNLEVHMNLLLNTDTLLKGLIQPDGSPMPVDEIDGEMMVTMPAALAAIPQSRKILINFNAGDGLQAIESLFTEIDSDRGTSLWPEFLQLAADHPLSPKATRVQTELGIDLDDPEEEDPTPLETGEGPALLEELDNVLNQGEELSPVEQLDAVTKSPVLNCSMPSPTNATARG